MARATRRFGVQIEGLAEFQRDIRAADHKLLAEFNAIMRSAVEPVVAQARTYYTRGWPLSARPQGWTTRTGRSLRGIRGKTHFGGAAVELGGSRHPHLLGQEWGSLKRAQFGPPRGRWHRSPDKAGTFLWPAWLEHTDQAEERVLAALTRARDTIAGANRGAGRRAGHVRVLRGS